MKVSKWGGSLAVRLPRDLVERMGLRPGDEVAITGIDGRLELTRADRRAAALERMASVNWSIPADYRFDREEANAREPMPREAQRRGSGA